MSINRRVYKQGNSAVISIPRWLWGEIGADIGAVVEVVGYPGQMITVTLLKSKEVAEAEKQEGTVKRE